MSTDQEVIPVELIEFTDRVIQIMVGSTVLILVVRLPRKRDIQKALDVILVVLVVDPLGREHDQCVDAVRAIFDREFDTGQQEDFILLCSLAKRFELVAVKFVVVGNHPDASLSVNQRLDVQIDELIRLAKVGEMLVRLRVHVEIGTDPR